MSAASAWKSIDGKVALRLAKTGSLTSHASQAAAQSTISASSPLITIERKSFIAEARP